MRSVFMARLIGETEKIVDAAQIPAAEFSSQVVVREEDAEKAKAMLRHR